MPDGTFELTAADVALEVAADVHVKGAGSGRTVIRQTRAARVFTVLDVAAEIEGVTITGGRPATGDGGGIMTLGDLTLRSSVVRGNVAAPGNAGANAVGSGAIGGGGTAGANGGGIAGAGAATLEILDSVVTGNAAGAGGAGGSAQGSDGSTASTGSGGPGAAGGAGGGVYALGPLTIRGSTISDNAAGDGGSGGAGTGGNGLGAGGTGGAGVGGVAGAGGSGGGVWASAPAVIADSTISGNSSGDGGAGGAGTGGAGGSAGFAGDGGPGGGAIGGAGQPAGSGAGLHSQQIVATNLTVTHNRLGAGGAGGTATGGAGGRGAHAIGGTGGNGGDGGNAIAGVSGAGGRGAAMSVLPQSASSLSHATVSHNTAAPATPATAAQGGAAGIGGAGDTNGIPGDPGDATAGLAGAPGDLAIHVRGASGDIPLASSILALNVEPQCEAARVADGLHNVIAGAGPCPGLAGNPQLGPLQDNGGPTPTRALGPGSDAIDHVPAAAVSCTGTDQRGVPRPAGAGCDSGAYEVTPPVAVTGAAAAITATSARLGGDLDANGQVTYRVEYGPTASYASSTPTAVIAGIEPAAVGFDVTGLLPETTYHYRLVAAGDHGASQGEDRTFTTAASPLPPDVQDPVFESASLTNKVFAVHRSGRAETPVASRARRGTTIRYALSEAARVLFTVQRARPGRRVGGKCRRPTRSNRSRRRCTRYVTVGRFAVQSPAGATTRPFAGRIGKRSLRAGRHRLVLVATDAAGNRSTKRRLSFRIVRR